MLPPLCTRYLLDCSRPQCGNYSELLGTVSVLIVKQQRWRDRQSTAVATSTNNCPPTPIRRDFSSVKGGLFPTVRVYYCSVNSKQDWTTANEADPVFVIVNCDIPFVQ